MKNNKDFYDYAYQHKLDLNSWFSVVPFNVLSTTDISDCAKVVYGIIVSLVKSKGYCWASNSYLGNILTKSPDTISRSISDLERIGFIKVEIDKEMGNTRKIYLTDVFPKIPIGKNADTSGQKSVHLSAKMPSPTLLLNNNNKKNNKTMEVFSFYKEKINPNSFLTEKTSSKINTRLKRFSVGELKLAIEKFSKNEWRMEHNAPYGPAWFFENDDHIQTFLLLKAEKQSEVYDFNKYENGKA